MIRHPLSFTLFPYPTLFRSRYQSPGECGGERGVAPAADSRQLSMLRSAAVMKVHAYAKINWALRICGGRNRTGEHTSEIHSLAYLACPLLLAKKKKRKTQKR